MIEPDSLICMKKYAIIVAGGTGTRMQDEIPKQFMLLNGKPIIQYSMEAFFAFDPSIQIIVVVHPDFNTYWKTLCLEKKIYILHKVVDGGKTRFDSVKNGLELIDDDGFVAIHDAARPFIKTEFIEHLFSEAETHGSAIPGLTLTDTIRKIDGDTSHHLDRKFLRAIQTPQLFKVSELKRAYEQPFQPIFTDDASVLEAAGFSLHLSEGMPGNIKITNPLDIALAEVLLRF